MRLLDTTVLVYAVGDPAHPLAAEARLLVEEIARTPGAATTTPEVLQELAHVRAKRRGRSDAALIARSFADLLAPLVRPSLDELLAGLELFEREQSLGSFDAMLAAVAMEHGLELVTADRAFAAIGGLEVHLLGDSG